MTFDTMRDRVLVIDSEETELRTQKEMLLKQLREQCRHEVIIETPYQSQVFFDMMPPRRMCLVCGLEENGWGCGYKKLVHEPVKTISNRDEFYRFRELRPLKQITVPENLFANTGT